MSPWPRILPPLLALLLAACASVPPAKPTNRMQAVVTRPPALRVKEIKPATAQTVSTPSAVASVEIWSQLRHSFAMAECDADPQILQQARRYTRNPRRLESQLAAVLPRLAYAQQAAQKHHVAGEFVLLPWIESHFRPARGGHNRPAGMWQIMPATALAMGLKIDRHYDGRLDVPAATDAVMTLLSKYHRAFHDWRIVDYAYNAGNSATRQMVNRYGMPPATPAIPQWPVSNVTRQHLTRLLAMACIVRDPARFNVQLPPMPAARRLVKVPIHRSLPLPQAAHHAGMSTNAMESLNAAFKDDMFVAGKSAYLVLPASHAKRFRKALERQTQMAGDERTASQQIVHSTSSAPVHTVIPGDSLWSISHHYSVRVSQLRHWNHLRSDVLKPGRTLQVGSDK